MATIKLWMMLSKNKIAFIHVSNGKMAEKLLINEHLQLLIKHHMYE